MHYKVVLITDELPTKENIEEIMNPYSIENLSYDEDKEELIGEYPLFTYDYYVIGGRYKGSLKLTVEGNDDYYRWGFYAKDNRNERLFYSNTLTIMKKNITPSFMFSEEDYFNVMGFRDGFLYLDGARMCDLIIDKSNLECFACVTKNEAIAREHWDGTKHTKDEDFDEKFNKILNDNKSSFVTILDIHD